MNELLRLTSSGFLLADVELLGDVESDSASLPLALSTMLAARERTSRGDSGKTGDRGLDISITCETEIRSSHMYGFGCGQGEVVEAIEYSCLGLFWKMENTIS